MDRTRKALLTSLFSVFLCLLMLCGSTYAWFVDSASSTGNKIVSGVLGVDLLMGSGSSYTSIANTDTNILGAGTWNPKEKRVVCLAIKNTGTIHVQYDIALSLSSDSTLAPVLDFRVHGLSDTAIPATYDFSAITPFKIAAGGNYNIFGYSANSVVQTIAPGETKYFAVEAHLNTEDNTYQGEIAKLSISVVASQAVVEDVILAIDADEDPLEASAVKLNVNAGNDIDKLIQNAFSNNSAVKVTLNDNISKRITIGECNEPSATAHTLILDLNGKNINTSELSDDYGNVAIYLGNNCTLILKNSGASGAYIKSTNNTISVFAGGKVEYQTGMSAQNIITTIGTTGVPIYYYAQ